MKSRKAISLASMILGVSMLSACGDGGGGGSGINSAGSNPTTNSSLAALRVSQSFTNNATTSTAAFDLPTSHTLSGASASAPLTIQYDAASNSYALSTQGRSQSFAPADLVSSESGQSSYKKTDGTNNDYLTLYSASASGASTRGPQYVGLGFWQRNTRNGSIQNTSFDVFTYGLETAANAVPRTGQAAYDIAVFGLSTTPGYEPREFEGAGRFDVNFQTGVFSASANTTETGLVTGSGITGGGISITGAGHLSSSDGTFSGTVGYGGANASGQGDLNGRFYGPNGTELGASFSATGTDGSATSGAFVGLKNSSLAPINLTLTNPVADQLFYAQGVQLEHTAGAPTAWSYMGVSQFTTTLAGNVTVSPITSDLPGGTFTAADQVTSTAANFTSYQKAIGGQTVYVDLYKPGSGNTELALTYLSFGRWSSTLAQPAMALDARYYFVYGLASDPSAIAARTGSAHYSGIAYGGALNSATLAAYDVKGSSTFDIDFSRSTYSGMLALKGSGASGAIDFGTFGFASTMNSGRVLVADVTQGGTNVGTISPAFYGPRGEEIGGPFQMTLPIGQTGKATSIVGVALAKGN